MIGVIATTAAFMAGSALAGGVGSAVVVNNCDYPVHLCNTPASGGGFSQVDRILQTGDSYSQEWTQLSNTMGWSIKLSKDESMGHNIMQYEYTYHGNDIIWYDMSEVDGNPWNGNFEITAKSASSCQPRQVAYRFATDDAYGMQDCPADSVITVTLCSGDNATTPDSGSSSGPSSYAAPASSSAPASSAAPAPSSSQAPAYSAPAPASSSEAASSNEVAPLSNYDISFEAATSETDSSEAPAPTATVISTPVHRYAATTLETVTQTDYVTVDTTMTAWAPAHKRHAHHARHAHN